MKYADKDKKTLAADLKTIYGAVNETQAQEQLKQTTEKWQEKYPNAMKSWHANGDVISPIFKFSAEYSGLLVRTKI